MSNSNNPTDPTQTRRSFREKWAKTPKAFFQTTLKEGSENQNWILNRNGFETFADMQNYLSTKKKILDGGCGNGRITALLAMMAAEDAEVVGIDLNADKVAANNLLDFSNASVKNQDLLSDMSHLGKFDFIYCQEVLHHTENPQLGFNNLVNILSDDGEIAIYVYRKKAPTREFVDDFIRDAIKDMSYEDSMEVSRQITMLGKKLSEIDATINTPAIPIMGIPEGEYHIQRFFYHFFMKAFWNDENNEEENVVINYDWYHPSTCSRHTLDEVTSWYEEANLDIIHSFEDEYGITMRGKIKT